MRSIVGAAVLVGLVTSCTQTRDDSPSGESGAQSGIGEEGGSTAQGGDDDAEDEEGGDKLDVAAADESGGEACPDGDGSVGGVPNGEFSLIWIANSAEGTVSKIDTREGIELARYRTSAGIGNPSRTSVNLYGDVAVMNREGKSVAKIAARSADCRGPSTSSGPDDVKAFGEDDCMLWWVELPTDGSYENGPRPVAWEGDESGSCTKNPRLWIGWGDMANATGVFRRLDGATGETLDEVSISGWEAVLAPLGPYGGAVDRAGNFWVVGISGGLARIDAQTVQATYFPRPANSYFYGIAMDAGGNPWIGDLSGVSWTYFVDAGAFRQNAQVGARGRGLAIDREGRVWMPVHANPDPAAGQCALAEIDGITGNEVRQIALPGCIEPVGVAVDADAFVWVVDKLANAAFKVDVDAGTVALAVEGLDAPYTYSDMTGAGLDLVVNPPAG